MAVCTCNAYGKRFPHRPGGGKCLGNRYECECGESFDAPKNHYRSGRAGHIDNWLPDEEWSTCPTCGSEDFEEVIK